jgi:hypothetical protein
MKDLLGGPGAFIFLVGFTLPTLSDGKPAEPKNAATPEQAVEFLAAASKAGDVHAALHQIGQPFHDLMLWYILQEETDDILRTALDQKFGKEKRKGFRMEVKRDLLRIRRIEILARDKGDGPRVKVRVRETVRSFQREGNDIVETTYLAVKEGDRWKVLRPFTALIFGSSEEDLAQEVASAKGPDGKETEVFKLTFKTDLGALGRKMQTAVEQREGGALPELVERARRTRAVAQKVAADVKGGRYTRRGEATNAFQEALRRADGKRP